MGNQSFCFPFISKYHESRLTNTLDLSNDDRLEQSSPMSSCTQLHIPYHKNKKHMKAKSTFFTFDLCSYTTNKYCKNENPASEPHPFYFNHPLLLSYPCLTPILMLAFEFQNAGFKHEHRCQGASETGNVPCPSTHGAPMYLWNGHSRG